MPSIEFPAQSKHSTVIIMILVMIITTTDLSLCHSALTVLLLYLRNALSCLGEIPIPFLGMTLARKIPFNLVGKAHQMLTLTCTYYNHCSWADKAARDVPGTFTGESEQGNILPGPVSTCTITVNLPGCLSQQDSAFPAFCPGSWWCGWRRRWHFPLLGVEMFLYSTVLWLLGTEEPLEAI